MLFSSPVFVYLFLPAVVISFFAINRIVGHVAQKTWLLGASLVFYGWWNPWYLPLLVSSVLVNWFVSSAIRTRLRSERTGGTRKWLFVLGLLFNLGLLGFFKYADFFISNVNWVAQSEFDLLHIILPLGISFFTLQQVAYLVDVYEGLVDEHEFINYALFVSFFPQLIAGPIVHHAEMMPQFAKSCQSKLVYANISRGIFIFAIGLFKKLVIADSLSRIVVAGFDQSATLNFIAGWLASLSFTLQLYFDFSAYTDMAIGAALMLNIRLPVNFNSPYKSLSVVEFWQRWHITLSVFITTYVYTPILRSFHRITLANAMVATLAAMLISGLWHGAAWTFVAWGGIHGIGLVICHLWRKQKRRMPTTLAWLVTISFVNFTNVFFRAQSMEDASRVIKAMLGLSDVDYSGGTVDTLSWFGAMAARFVAAVAETGATSGTLIKLGVLMTLVIFAKNSIELMKDFRPTRLALLTTIVLLMGSLYRIGANNEFLYFDF